MDDADCRNSHPSHCRGPGGCLSRCCGVVGQQHETDLEADLGNGSAAAVRSAQLSMLHSTNPHLRDVRAWAGFQVYTLGR
jgi:hypothetical protein